MKKTIIALTLAIYIASIAVVNFFGLEIKIFDGTEYVTGIQCDKIIVRNENATELEPSGFDGDIPIFVFDFVPAADGKEYTADEESLLRNPNAIELDYIVYPTTADNRTVRFEFDEEAMEGVAVFREDIRTLIFLKPGKMFTITIKSTDGSNKSASVEIIGVAPQQ